MISERKNRGKYNKAMLKEWKKNKKIPKQEYKKRNVHYKRMTSRKAREN